MTDELTNNEMTDILRNNANELRDATTNNNYTTDSDGGNDACDMPWYSEEIDTGDYIINVGWVLGCRNNVTILRKSDGRTGRCDIMQLDFDFYDDRVIIAILNDILSLCEENFYNDYEINDDGIWEKVTTNNDDNN